MSVKYVSKAMLRHVSGRGRTYDFGYFDGNTREDMIDDFLEGVENLMHPSEEVIDFLRDAENDQVLVHTTGCGNYRLIIEYFEMYRKY